MKKITLVIMAAGIGSRYGKGIKQLAAVGPNGEIIMDYSIYDAMEAGFNKVIFVIKKDLEKEFKEVIGNRIAKIVEVAYVYQELSDIPERFKDKQAGRIKPWGTGQAILCCKKVVKEPFLVINADDYYGKEAYKIAYDYLMEIHDDSSKLNIGMLGFVLKNTLSDNGTVTRGICKVDENHMLADIEETYGIVRQGNRVTAQKDGKEIELEAGASVSMNMWLLQSSFIDILEKGFEEFLSGFESGEKKEYLLPQIIGALLREGKVQVKVLETKDKWFGITYKEDMEEVKKEIQALIQKGFYPEKLYEA